MAKLSLTRRSFLKAAAVTGAASTLSFAAAPSAALAEGVDESAGEVKRIRSCCRACGKVRMRCVGHRAGQQGHQGRR